MSETPNNRRQLALAGLHRATATITDLFDAKDALHAALAAIAVAAGGPDPLRAAVEVGELIARLGEAVEVVRAIALEAAEFIPRKEVAAHLDSRAPCVFARVPGSSTKPAERTAPLPAPSGGPLGDLA
jgi:hypothetical protein